MGPKTDRRHLQGEESRRRILDAVIQIAAERGYEGTTLTLVSTRSGLPVSSIYWHFDNKDDMIAAVIRRSHDEWRDGLAPLPEIPPEASRRELLAAILHQEVGELMQHPEFLRFGLMLALEQRPEQPAARALFLEMRAESLARIVDGLELVLDLEHIGVEGLASELARFIMASVDGLFIASRASDAPLDPGPHLELLAAAVDLLIGAHHPSAADQPSHRKDDR